MNKEKFCDNNQGIILPVFLITLSLFATINAFIFLDGQRTIKLLGTYQHYLNNYPATTFEFSKLNSGDKDCDYLNDATLCYIPKSTYKSSVNFRQLIQKAAIYEKCNFSEQAFSEQPPLTQQSLKSYSFCKELKNTKNSVFAEGNVLNIYDATESSSDKALDIINSGFFYSSIILNNSSTNRLIAFGDIIIPELVCSLGNNCHIFLASITGNISVLSSSGNLSITAYANKPLQLPPSLGYEIWDLSNLPSLFKLPLSFRSNY